MSNTTTSEMIDALLGAPSAQGLSAAERRYIEYLGEFLADELSALESTRSARALAPNLAYYLADELKISVFHILPMVSAWYAAHRDRLIEVIRAELALR